jgi:hypothetical protein
VTDRPRPRRPLVLRRIWDVLRRPRVVAAWALVITLSIWTTLTGGPQVVLFLITPAVGATAYLVYRAMPPRARRFSWTDVMSHAIHDRPRRSHIEPGSHVVAVRRGDGPRVVMWVRPIEKGEWAVFTALGHGIGEEEVMYASELDQRERDWDLRYLKPGDLADQVWGRYFSG